MKAQWIWYPEGRTLPNTFVFFRKTITVEKAGLRQARGFIAADSRYQLFINGVRVQRGPAPFDPRHMEKDEFDIAPYLFAGRNTIAVLVAYFGAGDGTYVMGNPGLLLELSLDYERADSGGPVHVATDASWQTLRAKSWKAGNYKRHFLRALQENFDARLYPHGWQTDDFDDSAWRPARVLKEDDGRPVLWGTFNNLVQYDYFPAVDSTFAPRDIPFLREGQIQCTALLRSGFVEWRCPPEEYFDAYTEEAYLERPDESPLLAGTAAAAAEAGGATVAADHGGGALDSAAGGVFPVSVRLRDNCSSVLLFSLPEGMTGFPFIRFRAGEGTVAELLFGEGLGESLMLPMPQKGEWVRVTATAGETTFEAFDYDAVKYMAVLLRGEADQTVEVLEVGVNRLLYPFSHRERFSCSDETVNLVYEGAVNSARNVCLETIADNMSRERQQYSGEIGLTKLALYLAFGEYWLPARMIRTFSKGQSEEGWFLDCFPASDRLERLAQRMLGLSSWGPLLDHGVGFIYDIVDYALHSGELGMLDRMMPAMMRHASWLEGLESANGLLPVEGLGLHVVWLDHHGFAAQRDRQASLNIYYYGYWQKLAEAARWRGDDALAEKCAAKLHRVREALFGRFWDGERGMFVDNLPWTGAQADGEGGANGFVGESARFHDRSLSMALLFDLIPEVHIRHNVDVLAACPPELGLSHPVNAGWRMWALSKYGRADEIVRDFRERWGRMNALHGNRTTSEDWTMKPDQNAWCQCAVAPIYVVHGELLGVRPIEPGFARYRIAPQSGGLTSLEGETHTPSGPVCLLLREQEGLLELELPAGLQAEVRLPGPLRSAACTDKELESELTDAIGSVTLTVAAPQSRIRLTLGFNPDSPWKGAGK